jgi:anti-sigma28 factor (negative regulator of flagellin synthesis)
MGRSRQLEPRRTIAQRWTRVARIRARVRARRYAVDADATARALLEAVRRRLTPPE